MKKIILLLTLISALATSCYSQVDSSDNKFNDEYAKPYLFKAKNQKTTAWIFLGSGTSLLATGLLIGDTNTSSLDDVLTGVVIGGIGAVAVVASIPFFISSAVNTHKARVMISSQRTAFGIPGNVSKKITGITLSIPIGK